MVTRHASCNLLKEGLYLTDGGLETTLIYKHGIELAHFGAFELLCTAEGRNILFKYYKPYLNIARQYGLNFILETPTWRANSDWGYRLGYSERELSHINRNAVGLIRDLKCLLSSRKNHVVLSGNLGPRTDGYAHAKVMAPEEAKAYHSVQVLTFAETGVDVVTALALSDIDEATGIVMAAKDAGVSVVISFTVEMDGRLPGGEKLKTAIMQIDQLTDGYAAYFMINCAHPGHLKYLFERDNTWALCIRGIRSNAINKEHTDFERWEKLGAGDKNILMASYADLQQFLPNLQVVGGCFSTGQTHMEMIGNSLLPQ